MDVVATSGALPLSGAAVPLGSRTGPPDQPKRNLAFDSPVAERCHPGCDPFENEDDERKRKKAPRSGKSEKKQLLYSALG